MYIVVLVKLNILPQKIVFNKLNQALYHLKSIKRIGMWAVQKSYPLKSDLYP